MPPKGDSFGRREYHPGVVRLERWELSVGRFVVEAPDDNLGERVHLLDRLD